MDWINRNFPGFLLVKNRIVAAAGCPFWSDMKRHDLLHAKLERVNGEELLNADDLYRVIRSQPAGTPASYTLTSEQGKDYNFVTNIQRFSTRDFMALFGMYMLNGLLYLGVGVICIWFWPRCSSAPAFFSVGILASLWAFTACDLYGPYRFFRLQILAESLLPAAILHLALVFPEPLRKPKNTYQWIRALYAGFFLFALLYEAAAFQQQLYPVFNRMATACLALAMIGFLYRCTHAYFSGSSKHPKDALRILLFFAMAALGPSLCVALTMALQGHPPVNYVGYTSFLFPIGLAVAAAKTRTPENNRG